MEEKNNQMMMLSIIAIIAVIIVGVGIFLLANNTTPTTTTPTPTPPTGTTPTPTPTPTTTPATQLVRTFDLGEQNGSGQNGTVTLEEQSDGQTTVTISLDNPSATAEPAHIHVGSCPTPGAVKYPLTDVVNGQSITTIATTIDDLEAEGDLAVNVHKSANETSVYVSCGDLEF
jgi:hypothetical protein